MTGCLILPVRCTGLACRPRAPHRSATRPTAWLGRRLAVARGPTTKEGAGGQSIGMSKGRTTCRKMLNRKEGSGNGERGTGDGAGSTT